MSEEKQPKIEEGKYKDKDAYNWGKYKPTRESYQKDLCDWWVDYACRGEYKSILDVSCAIMRLKDYLGQEPDYEFDKDLTEQQKIYIIWKMLSKMQDALGKLDK